MANTSYSIAVSGTVGSTGASTSVAGAKKEKRTFTLAGPSSQGDEVTVLGSQDNTNFQVITDQNGQPLVLTSGTPTRTIDDNSLWYKATRNLVGPGSTLSAMQMCGEDLSSANAVSSTAVTSGSYTVSATDTSVDVNFAGAVAITLPAPTAGRTLKIRDAGGNASPSQAITATAAGGTTIDGQASIYISGAYGEVTLYGVSSTSWQVESRTPTNETAVKTGAYTATPWDDVIPVDTTGGAVTITLPATPLQGQRIVVVDATGKANVASDAITISGNGNNINGAASLILSQNRGHAVLRWLAGTNAWVTEDNLVGLPQLIQTATKNGAYTANFGEYVAVDATGGAVTITLPVGAAANKGQQIAIAAVTSAGTLTTQNVVVAAGAGQTIDGGAAAGNVVLSGRSAIVVEFDGTSNWKVVVEPVVPACGANLTDPPGNVTRKGKVTRYFLPAGTLMMARTTQLLATNAQAGDIIILSRADATANAWTIQDDTGATLFVMVASKVNGAAFIFNGAHFELMWAGMS